MWHLCQNVNGGITREDGVDLITRDDGVDWTPPSRASMGGRAMLVAAVTSTLVGNAGLERCLCGELGEGAPEALPSNTYRSRILSASIRIIGARIRP